MSINEVKAQMAAGTDQLNNAVRAMGGSNNALDNAFGQIQAAAQGSGHNKPTECLNAINAAKQQLEEARGTIARATKAAEEFSNSI